MKIIAVCGTLSAKSANLSLLESAAAVATDGVSVEIFRGLGLLPLFNPDIETTGAAPSIVLEWRRALAESDAVLIASPEYGHSMTGVIKNAIDWVIGSGELYQKTVAITAAVPHPERGRRGLQALHQTLDAVSARVVYDAPIVVGQTLSQDLRALLSALAKPM
jgi:chromate reductase